jgi:L-iditol 2-dehydrogenase
VITGIFAEVCVPWQSHITRRKELVMYNVRRSNHESETALELLREHPARFAPIITHTFPIGETQAAFEMLENYSDGAGKAIIQPGG